MKKLLMTLAATVATVTLSVGVVAASSNTVNLSNQKAVCVNNVWVLQSTTQNSSSGSATSTGGNATSGSATNSSGQTVKIGASCGNTTATPSSSTTPSGGQGGGSGSGSSVTPSNSSSNSNSTTTQVSAPNGSVHAGGGAGSRLVSDWSIAGLAASFAVVALGFLVRHLSLAK